MSLFGCLHLTWRINLPLHGFPTPPTLHPYMSTCGIKVASKILPKMVCNSASNSFNSLYVAIDRL